MKKEWKDGFCFLYCSYATRFRQITVCMQNAWKKCEHAPLWVHVCHVCFLKPFRTQRERERRKIQTLHECACLFQNEVCTLHACQSTSHPAVPLPTCSPVLLSTREDETQGWGWMRLLMSLSARWDHGKHRQLAFNSYSRSLPPCWKLVTSRLPPSPRQHSQLDPYAPHQLHRPEASVRSRCW